MKIVLATSNPHKVREFRQALASSELTVLGLDEVDCELQEPEEDADTFEGNARIKAQAYARALGMTCVAEDSGLEVDALGGAPGVRSARYASTGSTRDERDRANNEKLLSELAKLPNAQRTARFVCALCVADPSGQVRFETRGTYEGEIGHEPRGENGFGYDPLLYLPDLAKTSAELSPEQKNARSHRGQAARALATWLRDDAASLGT
jgi:XTP/dITP diphosphohydrolase